MTNWRNHLRGDEEVRLAEAERAYEHVRKVHAPVIAQIRNRCILRARRAKSGDTHLVE